MAISGPEGVGPAKAIWSLCRRGRVYLLPRFVRASQLYLRHMEPEHLSCLSLQGALLLSRSGTGATLRLHLSHQGSGRFTLSVAVPVTLVLRSRAEIFGERSLRLWSLGSA